MREWKKAGILWVMVLWIIFGGRVQAADSETRSPEEILQQCNEAMKAKAIIQLEQYVTIQGEEQKLLCIIADGRTGNNYVNMLGLEVYKDAGKQLIYYNNPTNQKWYVTTVDSSDNEEEQPVVLTPDVEDSQVTYTYAGHAIYRGIFCEAIDIVRWNDGTEIRGTYYIDAGTYLLFSVVTEDDAGKSEMIFHYPDTFNIPAAVVKRAVLASGTEIKQGKLEYVAVKSGNKQALTVKKGKKASGNVVIPDKVTFAGKQYAVVGIEDKAFTANKKITRVTLGKNIKSVGREAFRKCTKLKQVTIRSAKLSRVGNKAFYATAKKLKIKVPKAKIRKYKKLIEHSGVSSELKVTKL